MPKRSNTKPTAAATPTDWPPCDAGVEIAPLNQQQLPDLLNHRARRVVTREEALAHGWSMYWESQACRVGHQAARWTSNPNRCSDCVRIQQNKEPIYPTSRAGTFYEKPRGKVKHPAASIVIAPAVTPLEPDARDKKFLEAYAEHRSVERAAAAVGTTSAYIESRRACNTTFTNAMTALEERLMIPRAVLPPPTDFAWTPEVERHLIRLWIDTGDLQVAQDNVGVTPRQYFEHLEEASEFTEAIERGKPLASACLENRAHTLALAGNDRLLQKLLAAKKPNEYGDRMRIDMNVSRSDKLSDADLNSRLCHVLRTLLQESRYKIITPQGETINAIDAEFTEVFPVLAGPNDAVGEGRASDVDGSEAGAGSSDEEPRRADSNDDLL